ncbi:protein of unknown function [Stenotrophomonas maltophilia]|nr:protein of unknown function [Stenotrophomonas maltophilia]
MHKLRRLNVVKVIHGSLLDFAQSNLVKSII